jgi:putative transposase
MEKPELNFDNKPNLKGVSELSESDWQTAKSRFEVISPIIRGEQSVYTVARQSGVGKSTLYRWLEKYERTGLVTSLVNDENNGGRGKNRLPEEIDSIIQSVIEARYLTKQKITVKKVCQEIAMRCRGAGLKQPSYKAIRQRINNISSEDKLHRRYHRSIAQNRFKPLEGSFPGSDYPLAIVQIDHTPIDLIVVDDVYREPVGKPWITVAIDVYSRMVIGFYISLDPPGALGTGLCLSHAILPKGQWLSNLDIQGEWPCFGLMRSIYIDNAKEFHGKMLERACQEYGIEINFRPVATPNYGGHIERLLGTVLKEIHALPGTTFSNTKDRKYYDAEDRACFTIKELEQWLGIFIINVYHKRLHSSINTTPYAKYQEGILGTDKHPGIGLGCSIENELKLKLDFMPFVERSVQRYGVVIDFIYYYHDILRKWVHAYEQPHAKNKVLRKFIFKRDPRDISAVYFFDPEIKDYFSIPYRNTAHPSLTIWEHRRILRDIKNRGLEEVDEHLIFETYERLQTIEAAALNSTKSCKKLRNKTRKDQNAKSNIGNEFKSDPDYSESITAIEPTKKILPFEDLDDEPFK